MDLMSSLRYDYERSENSQSTEQRLALAVE